MESPLEPKFDGGATPPSQLFATWHADQFAESQRVAARVAAAIPKMVPEFSTEPEEGELDSSLWDAGHPMVESPPSRALHRVEVPLPVCCELFRLVAFNFIYSKKVLSKLS